MKIGDIPELPGYLTVYRVAKLFGLSKASIYYKIYEQQAFKHVYKIPGSENDQRPVLVVLESEVHQVLAQERARAAQEPLRVRLNAWNKRVKDWGRATNWGDGVPIHKSGMAHKSLVEDYLAANPNDPRPTE